MAPSSSSAAATSVQVALRIRPQTTQDSINIPARFQRPVIHVSSPNSVTVDAVSTAGAAGASGPAAPSAAAPPPKKQSFNFDQVHGPDTTQHTMFTTTAEPLISRFLEGFNCTILAYGQTSSGKTFTMTGIDLDADPADPNNGMGIVPRAVSTIFGRANKIKAERAGSWTYSVKGSFIEIYNEDLIDLLSMDDSSGGRREVQIREDKNGHIIWGGLREINVKNSNEVMELIRRGTSIRRTNETDMNAQSSRSHAIFSLTLTQKKYTGAGAPPRSSSPLPPAGRSPSRLARPASIYSGNAAGTRVASPTFGRPQTPSFAAAMGRGGGLRPSSALGHSSDKTHPDDEAGEWITIVSKFHFVDLAGSERLKRTAAAGERVKEGISINSGLLALGNVISALGDPARAKSHTATHVPYRDSKLTRLLQDSLGGNAHTLMIACISPAEYNAGETINTLKYANRARNIKNRAVVNEKEDGWDDLEWLQGTVKRLRKELKTIKEGGILPKGNDVDVPLEGAGKKVLTQLTQLQNQYEDLREKFVERTEELTRLRGELGESHRNSSGITNATAKYEEIVGPVIEEYEKTITTMEAELSLNRAALRHTNEMVEERDEELQHLQERHSATELYVEELRARLGKLTEREASTEAYVRDLEEKVKTYDESSLTSSESMTDLKREVAKFRDTEKHSATYIADLEARLARSDESILTLQQTIEKLEQESERRREEAEVLQGRLDALQNDSDNWRTDLEERERKVKELEEQMELWEQRRKEAAEERARLGEVVEEVASARRSLEVDMTKTKLPNGDTHVNGTDTPTDKGLEDQFNALQQTHTATLADLASVTKKYRDALTEISDLAAQIQEAKLNHSQNDDVDTDAIDKIPIPETPTLRRRRASGRSREGDALTNGGRRHFFKQAASTESLRSRSLSQSQSLSQELSSVHSRKTSFSSYSNNSHSPSTSPSSLHSPSPHLRNLSISVPNTALLPTHERSTSSLEKEIMRLQEVLKERESEITNLEVSLKAAHTTVPPIDTEASINGKPEPNGHAAEILSPNTIDQFDGIRKTMENGHAEKQENGFPSPDSDESLQRLNELMLSMAQKESKHRDEVEELNQQLTQTKRQLDDLTALSRDQAINMSSELESLKAKHASDLEQLEQLRQRETELIEAQKEAEEQLDKLRQRETELSEALKDVESKFTAAQEELISERDQLALRVKEVEELQQRVKEADDKLVSTQSEHTQELEKVKAEYEETISKKEADASITLHQTEEDYYNVLTKLRADHAEGIAKQAEEAASALERLKEEHAGELRQVELSQQTLLTNSESSQTLALDQLREEHSTALSRKESWFAGEIDSLKNEHARVLATKDEDLRIHGEKLRAEHDNTVAKLKEEWRMEMEALNANIAVLKAEQVSAASKAKAELEEAVQTVKEQQAVILREVERGREDEIAELKAAHESSLKSVSSQAEAKLQSTIRSHTEEVVKLKSAHEASIAELNNTIVAMQEQHAAQLEDERSRTQQSLEDEKERIHALLEDLKQQHAAECDTLRKDHDVLVQEVEAHKVAADEWTLLRTQAQQTHEQQLEEKSKAIKELEQQLSGIGRDRDELALQLKAVQGELSKTRSDQTKLIAEASKRESLVGELEHHRSVLADLQENLQKVKDEKDALQTEKNRVDSLLKDLQTQVQVSSPTPTPRPVIDRNVSSFTRPVPGGKLPPPTPPPAGPPPPAPRSLQVASESSQHSSLTTNLSSSSSSRESQPESPVTSVSSHNVNVKIEQQAKMLEEQEAMIKTLNKQLTHCESDLQTHMDLVSTLETKFGDSEKNLRKARMHATELARERDTLNQKIDQLRIELSESKREVMSIRQSIAEEKQSFEQKLDEERRAKERARQQLDARMDELQKRKSKFACI